MNHKILCEHQGEISYTTRTPVKVYMEGTVDLEETKTALVSSDMWAPMQVKRYEVIEVYLPDWLSPTEWIRNQVKWRYTWGMGVLKDWPENWQRGLSDFGETARYVAIKLLATKKFRSSFRESLRNQLASWLETSPENRRYASPLSQKQWDAATTPYDTLNARRQATSLYYSR